MSTDSQPSIVEIKTNKGDVRVQLDSDSAPLSTENFLQYVNDEYYDGVIFHRVIAGFMIQTGGYDQEMTVKTTRDSIKNEVKKGMPNKKYSLAMARTSSPDSATAQFFINLNDNNFLDYSSSDNPGYAVFGQVISGMAVVDAIGIVKTGRNDFPVDSVVIETIRVVSE